VQVAYKYVAAEAFYSVSRHKTMHFSKRCGTKPFRYQLHTLTGH